MNNCRIPTRERHTLGRQIDVWIFRECKERRGEEVEKKRKRLTERQKDSKGAALRDRTEKKIERERERERQRMSGMG